MPTEVIQRYLSLYCSLFQFLQFIILKYSELSVQNAGEEEHLQFEQSTLYRQTFGPMWTNCGPNCIKSWSETGKSHFPVKDFAILPSVP